MTILEINILVIHLVFKTKYNKVIVVVHQINEANKYNIPVILNSGMPAAKREARYDYNRNSTFAARIKSRNP